MCRFIYLFWILKAFRLICLFIFKLPQPKVAFKTHIHKYAEKQHTYHTHKSTITAAIALGVRLFSCHPFPPPITAHSLSLSFLIMAQHGIYSALWVKMLLLRDKIKNIKILLLNLRGCIKCTSSKLSKPETVILRMQCSKIHMIQVFYFGLGIKYLAIFISIVLDFPGCF